MEHPESIRTDAPVRHTVYRERFRDGGGWGYAAFNYNVASDSFTPATENDTPPQANDAKCGVACHTIVAAKDYIFTAYPPR